MKSGLKPHALYQGVLYITLFFNEDKITAHAIETLWQRLLQRLPNREDIAFLKEVSSEHFTKELCEKIGFRGIPKDRFLELLRRALCIEAQAFARRIIKMRSPGSVVLGTQGIERITMLIDTGFVTWVEVQYSEDELRAHLEKLHAKLPPALRIKAIPVDV